MGNVWYAESFYRRLPMKDLYSYLWLHHTPCCSFEGAKWSAKLLPRVVESYLSFTFAIRRSPYVLHPEASLREIRRQV